MNYLTKYFICRIRYLLFWMISLIDLIKDSQSGDFCPQIWWNLFQFPGGRPLVTGTLASSCRAIRLQSNVCISDATNDANIVITGGSTCCNDYMWCHQWWQHCHHHNFTFLWYFFFTIYSSVYDKSQNVCSLLCSLCLWLWSAPHQCPVLTLPSCPS